MKNFIIIAFMCLSIYLPAQMLISTETNTTEPNNAAVLDVSASDKGVLIPRLSTAKIENLKTSGNAKEGMMVFDKEKKCFLGFQKTDWVVLGDACQGSTPQPPADPVAFAGAFAFTSMRSSNPDKFSLLTFVDIPAGEVFYLTDNGWQSDDTFRTGEGVMQWTVTQPIPARTEIVFTGSGSETFLWSISPNHGNLVLANGTTRNSGPEFTTNGENVFIFTSDDDNNPLTGNKTFLAALKLEGPWDPTASSTSTSAIPTGLTENVTALALEANGNNQVIDCSKVTPGLTDTELRAVLNVHTNWVLQSATNDIPPACANY